MTPLTLLEVEVEVWGALFSSCEVTVVLAWLEEEVAPNCAGGGRKAVRAHRLAACALMPLPPGGPPWFPFLSSHASTLLGALKLYSGPDSTTVNSDIAIAGWYLRLRGGWAYWEIQAQRKGVDNLKSCGESVGG